MDFLFHKLSEKEKDEIKKQVDSILNSFSAKLSKLGEKGEKESFIESGNHQRVFHKSCNPTEVDKKDERSEGGEQDESFSREVMFKNAPEKNKDFIIAEKKKW